MTAIPSNTQQSSCHSHNFHQGNPLAERNTLAALLLTAGMMIIEIAGGYALNSMALLADGWHMSSHVLALGLAALAYAAARKLINDTRFCFGTWKIEVLGGYTSALLLLLIAGLMLWHSVERLLTPLPIHYNQAIGIALLGLLVNLLCAWLLHDGHGHGHGHQHDHTDLNLRAAYMHVIADAATSVLAIIALFGGKLWGANWLDPVMGITGATLVAIWAVGLLRDTGRALLDAEMDAPVVEEIHEVLAQFPSCQLDDLHVWRVAGDSYAVSLSVTSSAEISPAELKQALSIHEELVHMTVEINHC